MRKEDYQKYQENLSRVKSIMKYGQELNKTFGQHQVRAIKKGLAIMEEQMEKLAQDEQVQVSGEDKSVIKEVSDIFFDICVEKPISQFFRDLSQGYVLLIFNWNQALGKRPDINQKIKGVKSIVEAQMTMTDTIELLKILLQKNRNLTQYEPPAFELSKHYLESLRSEIMGEEETVSLEDLDLPTRVENILKNSGIDTISELTNKKVDELKEIKGLGEKSVEQVEKTLQKYNLSLK